MERIKTTEPSTIAISKLRITGEDEWRLNHIKNVGDSVYTSPEYIFLEHGNDILLKEWLGDYAEFRKGHLFAVMRNIEEFGQFNPIKIYKDFRINTGHKRAAALASLGKAEIEVIIVDDDTKL